MNPEPPLPRNAYLRAGRLHYLATIEGHPIWWDDGDGITGYLVDIEGEGFWTSPDCTSDINPAVAQFISDHASL